jgi:hypothetical protein
MSILSKASLVQIPSGYAEDKLYSEVPNTTAGDLQFIRASTGTRVNADGYIEDVPWNLLNYSEELTAANGWRQTLGLTTQLTTETNPINVNSCYKTIADTNTNSHYTYSTNVIGNLSYFGGFCVSFYAKPNGYNWVRYWNNNNAFGVDINIVTGEIQNKREDSIGTILVEDAANGWTKVSLQFDRLISYSYAMLKPMPTALGNSTFAGDGVSGMFLWGIQISKGLNFKSYIKRTDGFDVPRLDYSGAASCPTLLLEPQRANKSNNSEDLTVSGYVKNNCTATANQTTSPDNNQTADQLDFGSGSGFFYEVVTTITAASTYSVFVKYINYQYIQIIGTGDVDHYANFDIQNGIVGNTGSESTASIEDYGNGWYRCIINYNSGTFAGGARVYKTTSLTAGWASGGGVAGSFYFWGNQMEVGTFHTSYIPSSGTSTTRVAEFCNKTSISSLIGQTEGTFLLDFVYTGLYDNGLSFLTRLAEDNTNTNRIGIYSLRSSDALRTFCDSNNVSQFDAQIGSLVVGQRYKVAMRYKTNDYSIYLNGTNVYTNITANVPLVLNDYVLGNIPNTSQFSNFCKTNQATLFKIALTDDELETLTTI